MNVWEIAILKSINSLGGEAGLQQIYERLERGDFIQLTEERLRKDPKYGDRPMYTHQVRKHITNLYRAGELVWVSRGRYALTEKGLKRIGI